MKINEKLISKKIKKRLKDLENNQIWEEEEGESIIVNDSASAYCKLYKEDENGNPYFPFGNTKQKQYKGYNIINLKELLIAWNRNFSYDENSNTFIINNILNHTYQFSEENINVSFQAKCTFSGLTTFSIILLNSEGATVGTCSSLNNFQQLINKSACKIRFTYGESIGGQNQQIKIQDFQLEKGDTIHNPEPYVGEQASPNPEYPQEIECVTGTVNINIANSDRTLNQIKTIHLGDKKLYRTDEVGDYIWKDLSNGNLYLKHKWGEIILNGYENYKIQTTYDDVLRFRCIDTIDINLKSDNFSQNNIAFCNYFIYISQVGNYEHFSFNSTYEQKSAIQIAISKKITNTVDEFKLWLSNHNLKIAYQLENPTDELIEDETLIAELEDMLNNSRSYEGVTILENDGIANMYIKYVKSNKIQNERLDALENAIVNLGGVL